MLTIFVGRSAFFDNRNPNARGKFAHGCRKIDMLVFHHEAKDAAANAAAKTVKRLPLRADMKRRGLFLMKRTERFEIRACPLEWKIGADDFDHIICGGDLLDGLGWDHVFTRSLSEGVSKLRNAARLSKL